MIGNKFVSYAFHFQQSGLSEEEVKEQMFKYIEKVGAREDKKVMMDRVFELYSKIKKIQQETVVGEATPVSIEELEGICPMIDWKVLFKDVYMNESYNKSQVIVQHKEVLRKICETLRSEMTYKYGKNGIHTMLVIDFLYKMRPYLNKYVEDFYPSDIDEKPPSCIHQLKENFWWTINTQHEYSSISKSTKDEVIQMFEEMKRKLTELFSQGSWSSEDDKQKAISTVSNMKVAIMDSESLSEEYKGRDKILENKLSADNYFINAYYSMKAKFLTSLKASSHRYEL
ncbi:unnamed protein product [Schistosoma guineensis]|nr:unnamed protein product [Schistosoma guineensis]